MSVFIEVLAWIVIAFGAVPIVLTLLSLERAAMPGISGMAGPRPWLKHGQTCALSCR